MAQTENYPARSESYKAKDRIFGSICSFCTDETKEAYRGAQESPTDQRRMQKRFDSTNSDEEKCPTISVYTAVYELQTKDLSYGNSVRPSGTSEFTDMNGNAKKYGGHFVQLILPINDASPGGVLPPRLHPPLGWLRAELKGKEDGYVSNISHHCCRLPGPRSLPMRVNRAQREKFLRENLTWGQITGQNEEVGQPKPTEIRRF
ncbi:hypothetical protein R3P38DRAFT_2810572 [Favolaschia claudopus]|uniref:Uncharacterized protein n=1 Tax=Favolaschia claudopus TaxID=2862362 RepID=A0AAV9ZAH5_9AGAR